jgi:hypothetical protein
VQFAPGEPWTPRLRTGHSERVSQEPIRPGSRDAESVRDGGEVIDVGVNGIQAEAHRDYRDVGISCLALAIDLRREVLEV